MKKFLTVIVIGFIISACATAKVISTGSPVQLHATSCVDQCHIDHQAQWVKCNANTECEDYAVQDETRCSTVCKNK